jgi:hypothetical protein
LVEIGKTAGISGIPNISFTINHFTT